MEITLTPNSVFTRGRCSLCGAWFEWEDVVAVAYDGEESVGDVCSICLEAGPNGIRECMRDFADRLHGWASELEALAEEFIIVMPTADEYHTQCRNSEAVRDEKPREPPCTISKEWLASCGQMCLQKSDGSVTMRRQAKSVSATAAHEARAPMSKDQYRV